MSIVLALARVKPPAESSERSVIKVATLEVLILNAANSTLYFANSHFILSFCLSSDLSSHDGVTILIRCELINCGCRPGTRSSPCAFHMVFSVATSNNPPVSSLPSQRTNKPVQKTVQTATEDEASSRPRKFTALAQKESPVAKSWAHFVAGGYVQNPL